LEAVFFYEVLDNRLDGFLDERNLQDVRADGIWDDRNLQDVRADGILE